MLWQFIIEPLGVSAATTKQFAQNSWANTRINASIFSIQFANKANISSKFNQYKLGKKPTKTC